MSAPPELMPWSGADWEAYEDAIYAAYLQSVAHADLRFEGHPVRVQFHPESKHKGFGFWHLISEAPDQRNKNEEDRVPDLRRCERICWVAWCIRNAGSSGFPWWENLRWGNTHVVIWAEAHDFAVVLAKRVTPKSGGYYLLKTAYCVRQRNIGTMRKELDAWRRSQKG